MQGHANSIGSTTEYRDLCRGLHQGLPEQSVYGLTGSQKAHLVASLCRQMSRPIIIVTANESKMSRWLTALGTFVQNANILELPAREFWGREVLADSHDIDRMRMSVLTSLARGETPIVVTTVEAISSKLPKDETVRILTTDLAVGDFIDQRELINTLVKAGYERVDMVESRAHFSVRGGIVDVFPLLEQYPVRIEFFGDEIDSLRSFEPGTQRSVESLDRVHITPARELVWLADCSDEGIAAIGRDLEQTVEGLLASGKHEMAETLRDRIKGHMEKLTQGLYFRGSAQYFPYFTDVTHHLFDYSKEAVLIWDEPSRLKEENKLLEREYIESTSERIDAGTILPAQARLFTPYDELVVSARSSVQMITLSLLPRNIAPHAPQAALSIAARQAIAFHGQLDHFVQELRRWRKNEYAIAIVVQSKKVAVNLEQHLADHHISCRVLELLPVTLPKDAVIITQGELDQGFEVSSMKLAVLSEKDIFGEVRKSSRRRKPKVRSDAARITSYRELNVSDYVVHVLHGIGVYKGIKTLEIEDVHKDYLCIAYKGQDKLYVPVEQIDLVQKYVGSEGKRPKIYSLGGQDWKKVTARVKASVQEMARELLKLYAEREAAGGFAFSTDGKWQQEFEAAFPYEETRDQLRAITEVKTNMEQSQCMERLICGDVGYGKTEVAIRAAFKACMDGKQVAMLVPTTILAHQHYNTFISRFSDYPIKIAMMSRFRTAKENKQTIEELKKGLVDVVIGTHSLLGKEVKFKDLGLLIIDEEQRFGVRHKEKIKQLKANIDVLVLSATPIPRTLHMAMVGMRDLSVIETPPENRYPVQTYVMDYDPRIVREALTRELERGGQVYYVHNRVKDIDYVASKVTRLVPDARIAVAHGQMPERKLERIMLGFLDGEYDILLSTTIVESGLDIPNVNTIIIEDADKFGLSQLYQLRGRVGRSNRIGYAYLTYRRDKVLTEVAEKRLSAIKEFTELGAGFKIALRDLQIRGAGNILGPEQSGFVVQVGFDLYCHLLEQAVKELRGEKIEEPFRTDIDLNLDAYIPNRYISDNKQKVTMYKKIVGAADEEELEDVIDELVDRFGDVPETVARLLQIARIRILSSMLRIKEITRRGAKFVATFAQNANVTPNAMQYVWSNYPGKVLFKPEETVLLEIIATDQDLKEAVNFVIAVLSDLCSASDIGQSEEVPVK